MFAPREASSRGNRLLDLVAGNAADVGTSLNQVSSLIGSPKSVEKFLRMGLPVPVTSPKRTYSSCSTAANDIYSDDWLSFLYMDTSATETQKANQGFHDAIAKVQRFFYDESIEEFAEREGDVV
jgi:hypothetical protein